VIKAKTPEMMSPGVPEIILCLAAIQQGRKALEPDQIVPTVYGILTDSSTWELFRLDSYGILQRSRQFETVDNKDEEEMLVGNVCKLLQS
jgi:hypothetical protein